MTPEQLYKDAIETKEQGAYCGMTLVFGRRAKNQKDSPAENYFVKQKAGLFFSFDPDKVIRWLKKNGLVTG